MTETDPVAAKFQGVAELNKSESLDNADVSVVDLEYDAEVTRTDIKVVDGPLELHFRIMLVSSRQVDDKEFVEATLALKDNENLARFSPNTVTDTEPVGATLHSKTELAVMKSAEIERDSVELPVAVRHSKREKPANELYFSETDVSANHSVDSVKEPEPTREQTEASVGEK